MSSWETMETGMEECQQSHCTTDNSPGWVVVSLLFSTQIQIESNKTFLCWLALARPVWQMLRLILGGNLSSPILSGGWLNYEAWLSSLLSTGLTKQSQSRARPSYDNRQLLSLSVNYAFSATTEGIYQYIIWWYMHGIHVYVVLIFIESGLYHRPN